jgi:hypothetical protein
MFRDDVRDLSAGTRSTLDVQDAQHGYLEGSLAGAQVVLDPLAGLQGERIAGWERRREQMT